ITIIQVYALTNDYSSDGVEVFYHELEGLIKNTPKKDTLVAKVGPDAYEDWKGTARIFGWGSAKNRCLKLLEFASFYHLVLENIIHPHKPSQGITWHAPDRWLHNQPNYILTEKHFQSSINMTGTRIFPGADIGSDYDLVMMMLKLKLKKHPGPANTRIRYDLEKLKDPNIEEDFKSQISGKFT
uniref:Uncharacterized protein n=1 Tax=Latimeria chalumnae TaxID=7897 RepID=H3A2T9_LATCH